jgi:hypothetical protein
MRFAQERRMPEKQVEQLTEEERREIFKALVEAQDQAVGVEESRKLISERFGVPSDQVCLIEKEGLKEEWPPL